MTGAERDAWDDELDELAARLDRVAAEEDYLRDAELVEDLLDPAAGRLGCVLVLISAAVMIGAVAAVGRWVDWW